MFTKEHLVYSVLLLDTGKKIILLLRNSSAALDTIYHDQLICTLHNHLGISGKYLNWITSYITSRSFQVITGYTLSQKCLLKFGVPQGSVPGPLLYTAYTSPLATLIQGLDIEYHFYGAVCEVHM